MSTIRQDFEELSTSMAQWRRTKSSGAKDAEAKRPIDRIVLYIDDLDRCEPDQVVAVLQAVNLLVAMDLFIVIVGVDPRWLLRSLRSRYDKLLGSSSSQDAGELSFKDATPQNYLEKIFQVPFVLPGLGAEGLGQLFTALARGGAPPDDTTLRAGGAATADRTAPRAVAATAVGEIERAPRAAPNAASPRQAAPIGVEQASEVAAIDLAPEAVTVSRDVTSDELALLARLHPLIRTPRSAKRLLNIYRLLRSTRDLRPAARFLGSDGQPGEYQAVAILLAVLTAHPELLGSMLWGQRPDGTAHPGTLCNGGGAAGWRAFVCGLRPRAPEPPGDVQDTPTAPAAPRWCNDVVDDIEQAAVHSWNDLVDALELINGEADRPFVSLDDIEPFRLWGPRVARFSFVLSAFATEAPTVTAGSAGPAPN